MDGGRRLLRSLKEAGAGLWPAFSRAAPVAGATESPRIRPTRARAPRLGPTDRFVNLAAKRGVGLALAVTLVGGSFLFGAVRGGQYDQFVAEFGSPGDLLARGLGFGLDTITISGARDLYESEVLKATGLSAKNSLLLIDAAAVRSQLLQVPLVREASVRKLFPDKLLVEITERDPFAVWQRDGELVVVSADGTVIEKLRDERFADLPWVVGAGANKRVAEYQKIVEAGGDIGARARAGVLVGERRWNIKMQSGLDVKLPERDAAAAFAQFAKLARETRLLEKDLLYVDLRAPGKMFVRLSEEAAAHRAEAMAAKKKGKGGQT